MRKSRYDFARQALVNYRGIAALLVWSILAGCVAQPYPIYGPTQGPYGPPIPNMASRSGNPAISQVNLQTLPQTIGLEHRDRVARFERLAHIYGIAPPKIDEMQLASGQVPGFNHPIPVVRIVFDAKVLFDFDRDTIRPEAQPIIAVIAENMHRDVPDANLLVLGHTDAIGTDEYNVALSRRRAVNVMQALMARGVAASQLTTVAIGKSQPIAPNDTEEGRARNRRVEFMISASQEANLQLVERRRIVQEYLRVAAADVAVPATQRSVEVLKPVQTEQLAAIQQDATLQSPSMTQLRATNPVSEVTLQPVGQIELQKPLPLSDIQLQKPSEIEGRELDKEFVL